MAEKYTNTEITEGKGTDGYTPNWLDQLISGASVRIQIITFTKRMN